MATDKERLEQAQKLQKALDDATARKKDDAEIDLAKERASGGNGGEQLDKFLTAMDAMSKKLDSAFERMDALEAHHKKVADKKKRDDDDDDHHDDETEEQREERLLREGRSSGEARPVVADAARRHALADAQTRVDAVAQRFGQRSDAPLHGESVRAYRTRQLRRYQKFSPMYKAADLDTINDEAVFSGVEERIYADACAAADSPDSIAPGTLRMRTRVTESGHRINEFFGSPNAWMDRFAANRRYVVRLNTKWGGGPTE
jgi:hypothetical protein